MEAAGGQSGGGPAPFLLKTYDMVDDDSTDEIVSWSSAKTSFIVWNPPEFSRVLLPTYFKHNNFSSFIRQLNTYGFRKSDPERWEFANEDFIKGQKHLLKNIHRRKPIHSHSHPPAGPAVDSERAAMEEEIEQLSREKAKLQADLLRFRQQHVMTDTQLEELERRMLGMEQRQRKLIEFLARAVQNPTFVEHLVRMVGAASIDFSAYNKKRRQLPSGEGIDGSSELLDNSPNDDRSSTCKPHDFSHLFPQDFSDKLKLELSPADTNSNLVSLNAQTLNGNAGSPQKCQLEGAQTRTECRFFVPEEVELMDTSASLCLRKSASLTRQSGRAEDVDGHISCELNLTLSSSPLQFDESLYADRVPISTSQNVENVTTSRSNHVGKENSSRETAEKDQNTPGDSIASMGTTLVLATTTVSNQGTSPATGRVNDIFWEQFLTERPGSSENEEACSGLRSHPIDERREEGKPGNETAWRSNK